MTNTMENNDFQITVDEIFPQGEMMLVDPIEFSGEQSTKSGIVLVTEHTQATPTLARILRAGPDAKYKEDSIVFFRRYSLDEIEVKMSTGKRKLNFINTEDVISEYRPKKKK